ncbi:universal stress protein [Massilia niastensis]|uniref:universal stress protein n=1 Tax=Massilia niastensis TaxID=544911 RepID=UPI000477DA8B|nr:universal stress protein [Massilia niastensis]
MYKKILMPTDGSALSERAAAAAIALARGCGADIVALSVAQPCFPILSAATPERGRESELDRMREAAARHADRVARLARNAGVPCSSVTVASPDPADAIIRAALDLHCDLILIAAHGQRGLTRLIAGSVPQRVLAYSPVPVILFHGNTEPA